MIDFVYFDLGNVLVNFDHDRGCRQVASLAHLTPERVRSIIFDSELQAAYEAGRLTTKEFCEEFNRRAGTRLETAAFAQAASDIFWLNDPIWPLIDQLLLEERRLGVLSNTCDAHWAWVTGHLVPELCQKFDEIVLSFEEGVAKPDSRIYELAAARAGVAPERIFFTDDRPENISAAQHAGWQAHLFESAQQTADTLASLGVTVKFSSE
ncbi:MAG TPA: HAD family phosphatase [Pirellulaceae bacterium]|nr:HAD family phosphatase [Pirellulaceae bacterium]